MSHNQRSASMASRYAVPEQNKRGKQCQNIGKTMLASQRNRHGAFLTQAQMDYSFWQNASLGQNFHRF
ncbi:MAG: hypothetical protein MK098_12050 [Marinovum sp.]|nr:hypothetical protein [Marinovum sp.]